MSLNRRRKKCQASCREGNTVCKHRDVCCREFWKSDFVSSDCCGVDLLQVAKELKDRSVQVCDDQTVLSKREECSTVKGVVRQDNVLRIMIV